VKTTKRFRDFVKWVKQQPDGSKWPIHAHGCIIVKFLRDKTNIKIWSVWEDYFTRSRPYIKGYYSSYPPFTKIVKFTPTEQDIYFAVRSRLPNPYTKEDILQILAELNIE
jgi:hypothetical protein